MAIALVEHCGEPARPPVSVGVLLLAAGRSRRFGQDKRLALLQDGKTVIQTTIDQIKKSGLPLKVCVSGDDFPVSQEIQCAEAEIIFCSRSHRGMGATLSEGIEAAGHWKGTIIALADMPWVAPSTYRILSRTVSSDWICIPEFRGSRGNPVALGSSFYPELRVLNDDIGARRVLKNLENEHLKVIPVDDAGVLRDVDTKQDIV